MTAAVARPGSVGTVPAPRSAGDDLVLAGRPATGRAVAYQRVLHQMVRRELRLLAELAAWAPADEPARTGALTAHADLMGRVLLHHHAVERELLWPALLLSVPADRADTIRAAHADWTARCARIDAMLRAAATTARQWGVTRTRAARDAFALTCLAVADAVDAQIAAEERDVLPALAAHLHPADWTSIARAGRCRFPAREQLLVLGLALEDACAADRARLLEGLPRSVRLAWRLRGRRGYRAAVVRLRGAPPAR
jgi:Hemerythrin HHE cation binding domain